MCVYCDDYHIFCVLGPHFTVNYPLAVPEEMGASQTLPRGCQPGYIVESHLGPIEVLRRLIQDGLKMITIIKCFLLLFAL